MPINLQDFLGSIIDDRGACGGTPVSCDHDAISVQHSNNGGAMCDFNICAVLRGFRWHLYLQWIFCVLQEVEEVAFVIYCALQPQILGVLRPLDSGNHRYRALFPRSLAVTPGLIFVNTPHAFEQFLRIRTINFLTLGSVVITIAIAGADGFCISLLALQLSNHIGCHFISPFW